MNSFRLFSGWKSKNHPHEYHISIIQISSRYHLKITEWFHTEEDNSWIVSNISWALVSCTVLCLKQTLIFTDWHFPFSKLGMLSRALHIHGPLSPFTDLPFRPGLRATLGSHGSRMRVSEKLWVLFVLHIGWVYSLTLCTVLRWCAPALGVLGVELPNKREWRSCLHITGMLPIQFSCCMLPSSLFVSLSLPKAKSSLAKADGDLTSFQTSL
jgi:hypothetical protein